MEAGKERESMQTCVTVLATTWFKSNGFPQSHKTGFQIQTCALWDDLFESGKGKECIHYSLCSYWSEFHPIVSHLPHS